MSKCNETEKAYVKAVQSYFDNLSPLAENSLKREMRRPFTTGEQEPEGMVIIEQCATKKLGLNDSSLPFGWMKGSRCDLADEMDILGTWRTKNADCLPMWYNLKDRAEFFESCIKSYDIRSFKRKGRAASDRLETLAFNLHKHEKQNAKNKIGGGSAMIAGGIMAGIGVLLAPVTGGGSLALSYTGSALSLSGTIASMIGENPEKVVNDAVTEMKELRDDGNSISALLILYMVSHDDLQKFANGNQYRKLISKYEKDIHSKLQLKSSENLFSGMQALNLASLSRKLLPEIVFCKTLKEVCKRQIAKVAKPLADAFRSSLPETIANMKLSTPAAKRFLPKIFRNSKAVQYLKKVPGFPALASAFSVGLGIWEVFEGTKGLQKGMYHHVKLASRKTLLMTDEVVEAYSHILRDDINMTDFQEFERKEEAMTVVYVHVAEGNWDYLSGMHLRFESNGRQCVTATKYGLSVGWIEYDTRDDLGSKENGGCYRFKIKDENLTVSVTSEQNSLLTDEVTIDAVHVASEGRFLPTFKTNDTTRISVSGQNVSLPLKLYSIRNRLVQIKTHTSTQWLSGTDAKISAKITMIQPNDGNDILEKSKISSEMLLDNGDDDLFENDNVDKFKKGLFKLGLNEFLDHHPIGAIDNEINEGDIKISFKSTDGGLWSQWNVDLIKLYFIGIKGQHIIYTCHTGEKWIKSVKSVWHEFDCELHRPENPRISVENLKISVCDKADAGSASNRIKLKFCRNARDFGSEYFDQAVNKRRCCETNYFSGSYTRGEITSIDGNTIKDDGGEKLGQCEGFEMSNSSYNILVKNEHSDAVCFNNIEFYASDDKGLKSSTYPIPFKSCNIPNLWAEKSKTKIEDDYPCSTWHDYNQAKSTYKCHLNSKINFSSLKVGICNRNYAASYDPLEISICDESLENCCTTDELNNDQLFNSYGLYHEGSYIKKIDLLKLGSCKDKLLSDTVAIKVNLKGTDGLCLNYFQLGEQDGNGNFIPRTSTTCQHSEIHCDSNKARICPRDISYEKAPVHCPGSMNGRTLQRIAMMVSDKENSGSSDEIKFMIKNSDGNECETKNLNAADTGNYQEYTNFGEDCKKLLITDYVQLWVATINHNDNLFLTHLYLDVADDNGVTKQMACLLDQNEEFFVIVHGNRERFGVPLKCM